MIKSYPISNMLHFLSLEIGFGTVQCHQTCLGSPFLIGLLLQQSSKKYKRGKFPLTMLDYRRVIETHPEIGLLPAPDASG